MTKIELHSQIVELTEMVQTLFERYRVLVIEAKLDGAPYPKHVVFAHWQWDSKRVFDVVHGFGSEEDIEKMSTHYKIPKVLFQRGVGHHVIRDHLRTSGFRNGYFVMDSRQLGLPDWPIRRDKTNPVPFDGQIQFIDPAT